MHKNYKNKGILYAALLLLLCFTAGCKDQVLTEETVKETVKVMPGAYDSVDKALVVGKNKEKQTITFFNFRLKKNYTLGYDGTTCFYDKYGSSLSAEQLKKGEVTDIYFLKGEKLLSQVMVSPQVWQLSEVKNFQLDLKAGRMKIQDAYYTLSEDTVVFSGDEQVEFLDIHEGDTLSLRGNDKEIFSINIEQGHGYLRLENAEYFIGGWIELGRGLVKKIEEDMLLTVPEGTHKVYVSHTGLEGEKEVKILRGKETKMDLGDLKKDDLIKYGNLIFVLEPSEAKVYIDGKEIDTTRSVKAEYGLHQIMVTADGYETLIQYIRVSAEGATLAITLDKEKDKTVSANGTGSLTVTPTPIPSVSSNGVSGNTTTSGNSTTGSITGSGTNIQGSNNTVSTTGYKVEIKAPVGAEVYVDGNYVGIIPTSFKKQKGTYQIVLRKSGYESRSYTIEVQGEERDVPFSFSELQPN